MKKICLLIVAILGTFVVNAQQYKIEVNIEGVRDSMLLLVMHRGENKYVRDTAYMDKKGRAVFTKSKPLDGGMYCIAMNGAQLFDFLISDNAHQQFSMTSKKDDYTQTLHFNNSPENEEFANFNRYMADKIKNESFLKTMMSKTQDEKTKDSIKTVFDNSNADYHKYVEKISPNHKGTLLLSLVKMMDKTKTPDFKVDASNPKADSIRTMLFYEFTKNHFFDNYNFTDNRLLNTPVFIPSFDYFFDNVVVQIPDSIIVMVDTVLKWAKPSSEMTEYIAGNLFNKYMESNLMGMESVVIHLIDNYYLKGTVSVTDTAFKREIKQFANRNRSTLIGKQAADLKMQTLSGQYEALYAINAPYMLVYFFEPNCGHCKKETPKVFEVYKKYQNKGLQAFCVYTQHDKEEWLKYVAQNQLDWINVWDPQNNNNFRVKYNVYTVPQVYLLDKNKKIIGRRLDAEGLDKILENVFKTK